MNKYSKQVKLLLAVDCILFGFDGASLKVLLVKRGIEPKQGKWSLVGGFVQPTENVAEAAGRILASLTGLANIYMEELQSFSEPSRDPVERTVSLAYFSLIDINNYQKQFGENYKAEWFPLKTVPKLVFDHSKMLEKAKQRLQYKSAFHPILFEMLPPKFTLPQLQNLYEQIFDLSLDTRNFSRKFLSTGLLLKQVDKDKSTSKKGAFFYKLNKKKYSANFHAVLNIIPNQENIYLKN